MSLPVIVAVSSLLRMRHLLVAADVELFVFGKYLAYPRFKQVELSADMESFLKGSTVPLSFHFASMEA